MDGKAAIIWQGHCGGLGINAVERECAGEGVGRPNGGYITYLLSLTSSHGLKY